MEPPICDHSCCKAGPLREFLLVGTLLLITSLCIAAPNIERGHRSRIAKITPSPDLPTSESASSATTVSAEAASESIAIHVGSLKPASEAAAIDKTMKGLCVVPGTDVRVGYDILPAGPLYEFENATLSWREPQSGMRQILVSIQDAADLRIIPYCRVLAQLTDPGGKDVVSTTPLHLIWDPEFYRYGANIVVPPEATTVTLSVRIDPPEFRRNDKRLGAFFVRPAKISFPNIVLPALPKQDTTPAKREAEHSLFPQGRHPAVTPTPYPGSASK